MELVREKNHKVYNPRKAIFCSSFNYSSATMNIKFFKTNVTITLRKQDVQSVIGSQRTFFSPIPSPTLTPSLSSSLSKSGGRGFTDYSYVIKIIQHKIVCIIKIPNLILKKKLKTGFKMKTFPSISECCTHES